jgi:hypothetical protein
VVGAAARPAWVLITAAGDVTDREGRADRLIRAIWSIYCSVRIRTHIGQFCASVARECRSLEFKAVGLAAPRSCSRQSNLL